MLRRILVLTATVIAIVLVATQWIMPVALSFQTLHKPPQNAWLLPRAVPDNSVSHSPVTKLSYFSYQFEIPWIDIDNANTKSYPDAVLLTFNSGLKLMVGASSPKLLLGELFGKSKVTQARVEQSFGIHSDYDFFTSLYNFTPDNMHLWAISPRVHYRETVMLDIKSVMLSPEAETGFFYVGNSTYKGFQQGDPQAWPSNYHPKCRSTVLIKLFSDEGSLNLTLLQRDFRNPAGISQADVNRIIQSVQRAHGEVAEQQPASR